MATVGDDAAATAPNPPMHEILNGVQRGVAVLQQRANNEDDMNQALLTLVHNAGVQIDRLANGRQSTSTYYVHFPANA